MYPLPLTFIASRPKFIYSIGRSLVSVDVAFSEQDPLNVSVSANVIVSDVDRAQALSFHYEQELLFYSDTMRGVIYRSTSNGTEIQELTVQQPLVEGIARSTNLHRRHAQTLIYTSTHIHAREHIRN